MWAGERGARGRWAGGRGVWEMWAGARAARGTWEGARGGRTPLQDQNPRGGEKGRCFAELPGKVRDWVAVLRPDQQPARAFQEPNISDHKMSPVDAIVYGVFFIVALIAVWMEQRFYVCDQYTCKVYTNAAGASATERDRAANVVTEFSAHTMWYRAYLVAFLTTVISYWWIMKRLPPVREFIALFAIVFVIAYFSVSFYQHHFIKPLGHQVKEFIATSCRSGANIREAEKQEEKGVLAPEYSFVRPDLAQTHNETEKFVCMRDQ